MLMALYKICHEKKKNVTMTCTLNIIVSQLQALIRQHEELWAGEEDVNCYAINTGTSDAFIDQTILIYEADLCVQDCLFTGNQNEENGLSVLRSSIEKILMFTATLTAYEHKFLNATFGADDVFVSDSKDACDFSGGHSLGVLINGGLFRKYINAEYKMLDDIELELKKSSCRPCIVFCHDDRRE